jgi:prepilin-type N-terminal cleavage/methylation domain-containing protein
MKKNGFTLAELLGVLVILSLIALITVPAVTDSLQTYKVKLCNTQVDEIVEAARTWGSGNVSVLPTNDGETYTLSLRKVADSGFIDSEIQNPVTKEYFDLDDTKIVITRVGKKYTYEVLVYDDAGNLVDAHNTCEQ